MVDGGALQPDIPEAQPIDAIETTINDSDSGYDENALSTASITSSIAEFEQENGRTYHKTGKYVMPNDEAEQQRMDSESGHSSVN